MLHILRFLPIFHWRWRHCTGKTMSKLECCNCLPKKVTAMKLIMRTVMSLCVLAPASICSADIIQTDYNFNVTGIGGTNIPMSGNDVAALAPTAVTTAGATLAEVSFSFTGSQLSLGVDWTNSVPGGLAGFGAVADWVFTDMMELGPMVANISNVTFNLGASTVGSLAGTNSHGVVTGFTPNSITIQTPDDATLGSAGVYNYVFDISDTSTVPEPSSFAILAMGGFGYLGFRRRRRSTELSE